MYTNYVKESQMKKNRNSLENKCSDNTVQPIY